MQRGASKNTTGENCFSGVWTFSSVNRLSPTPQRKVMSCNSHSPPLSHTGQSSGWLVSRNSSMYLRAQGLDHTAARGGWLGYRRRRRLGRAGGPRREPRPVASALLAPATELSTGSSHQARTATEVPREQRPQPVFVGRPAEHPGGIARRGNPRPRLQRPSLGHVTLRRYHVAWDVRSGHPDRSRKLPCGTRSAHGTGVSTRVRAQSQTGGSPPAFRLRMRVLRLQWQGDGGLALADHRAPSRTTLSLR